MSEDKKVTDAQKRATAKYEKSNYDKILVRFPKGKDGTPGVKERIQATGETINGFINKAVENELNRIENK